MLNYFKTESSPTKSEHFLIVKICGGTKIDRYIAVQSLKTTVNQNNSQINKLAK